MAANITPVIIPIAENHVFLNTEPKTAKIHIKIPPATPVCPAKRWDFFHTVSFAIVHGVRSPMRMKRSGAYLNFPIKLLNIIIIRPRGKMIIRFVDNSNFVPITASR